MYGNDTVLTAQQEMEYQHSKQYNFAEDFHEFHKENYNATKNEIMDFVIGWEYKSREIWLKKEGDTENGI